MNPVPKKVGGESFAASGKATSAQTMQFLVRSLRPAWVVAGFALLAVAGVVSFLPILARSGARAASEIAFRNAGNPSPSEAPIEGPWGKLVISDLWLEPPAEVLAGIPPPDQRPIWRFPRHNLTSVREHLGRVGVAAEVRAALFAPNHCIADENGVTLLPPIAVVEGLAPSVRQALYTELARHPENALHHFPMFLPHDLKRELEATRLSGWQRDAVMRLRWSLGGLPVFSDLAILLQRAQTSQEIDEARRVCSRAPAVRVSVVSSGDDPDGFRRYWGAGGRNTSAQVMVRAVARGWETEPVDAAMLLPSLVRERLYTYPDLSDSRAGRLPDCHWTALNFFAESPEPYYLDPKPTLLQFATGYEAIEAPTQLGDLVCIFDAAGEFRHSCVYVAAGVVFTKNGQQLAAPWILQRMSETMAIYGAQVSGVVRFFRQRVRSD